MFNVSALTFTINQNVLLDEISNSEQEFSSHSNHRIEILAVDAAATTHFQKQCCVVEYHFLWLEIKKMPFSWLICIYIYNEYNLKF